MAKKRAKPAKARMPTRAGRGRPPVHNETWSKVSVVLFDRQIVHLDRIATDIRGQTAKVMAKSLPQRSLMSLGARSDWIEHAVADKNEVAHGALLEVASFITLVVIIAVAGIAVAVIPLWYGL